MINVTKTFLPPQKEYDRILNKAWENEWITNRGNLVIELEQKLCKLLGIEQLILTANGTLPLQIAIKALGLKGDIITTPFSYVATTSSIVWENCKPIFVDIDPEHLTIDENKIESAITPQTCAIIATHVFGNPCNIEVIEKIAKKHSIKVIYDAAHSFGVSYNGNSIFKHGDVSTCSFHATKLFHTGEGGAMICNDEKLRHKLFYHHNFGHNGPEKFWGLGINAKMSELHAAMGLSVLPYYEEIISSRKSIVSMYKELMPNIKTIKIRYNTHWNYSYHPIILEDETVTKKIIKVLNQSKIYPRRYFFPSLNKLPYVEYQDCPISESIASSVLCLPLYYGLEKENIVKIASIINSQL